MDGRILDHNRQLLAIDNYVFDYERRLRDMKTELDNLKI